MIKGINVRFGLNLENAEATFDVGCSVFDV